MKSHYHHQKTTQTKPSHIGLQRYYSQKFIRQGMILISANWLAKKWANHHLGMIQKKEGDQDD